MTKDDRNSLAVQFAVAICRDITRYSDTFSPEQLDEMTNDIITIAFALADKFIEKQSQA